MMRHRSHSNSLAAFGAALALLLLAPASLAWAAETIDVKLGYSEVMRIDEPAETVVVGNDQMANATIAAHNTIVVTGNALGSTNLILLDDTCAEIASSVVRVVPVDPRPQHAVGLISGGADECATVYLCGPEPSCTPAGERGAGVADTLVRPEGENGRESLKKRPDLTRLPPNSQPCRIH